MRIASLLPAASEWIAAFGASDELVARSHECNHPPEVTGIPVVTSTSVDKGSGSAAIDREVRQHVNDALSLYHVDIEALKEFRPDLIVTQDQCDVCGVSGAQLPKMLESVGAGSTEVLSIAPMTLKQVVDEALRLGRKIGRTEKAMQVIARHENALQKLRNCIGSTATECPSVICIEWMDPLMTAAHWVPDCVEHAGGEPLLAEAGTHSRYVEWADIVHADPDVICVMPCGFKLERSRANIGELIGRSGWSELQAVQNGRVYFFNGDAYFNRPGPRLYRSVELLAQALHPSLGFPGVQRPRSLEMARLRTSESV